MQDDRIVEMYWKRNETAIKETKDKYDRCLTKFAYNILANYEDSREAVNDTYLAAWNSIPPHKPNILSTYLGKLTRRISMDIFRKRTRTKRIQTEYIVSLSELGDCVSGGDTPEEAAEMNLLVNVINTFLSQLPEDARNLFVGRYYYMDPLREVAGYCDMSESKAKSMLYRTRCSLKLYLEGFVV